MMANVFEVADFFIQIANQSEDDQMTNLKLNKLLYYAQGVFLARTNNPLFDNNIEAWPHGPVVPEVYHKYKVCGKNSIPSEKDDLNSSSFSEEELETLLDVMREFGQYTGSALVAFTHKEDTPWSNTIASGFKTMKQSGMRDYFIKHPVPYLKERMSAPKVKALPSEWYNPEEDAEWEAYL